MCGISGFLNISRNLSPDRLRSIVTRMSDTLTHRGPDSSGVWVDATVGIALGHRRLAILDLSPEGHQPMHSACGRYVTVFNGEIYNYRDLKETLGPRSWRGHSDTEVLLAAVSAWGLEATLKSITGMFAIALWDKKERVLYLARDRLGEKPLYYGKMGQYFLFASEIKALKAHPAFNNNIDRDALALYLRYNYIPAPYSIYHGVYKLQPGTMMCVNSDVLRSSLPLPYHYWSARNAAEAGSNQPFAGSESEAISELDRLLRDSIRNEMVADVPLGAFLSGGIDSSTVVALMQAQSMRPVKTFSIGFHEKEFDEAQYAKEVARHLGTDHTELYVTPKEAMEVIPKLPRLYDEPFSDSSQIPTFLLSQMVRRHVTVSLSGDGGDELFGGYNRYSWGRRIWKKIGWIPAGIRENVARVMASVSPGSWNRAFRVAGGFAPAEIKQGNPGDKVHKLAQILAAESPDALYRDLVSLWHDPTSVVLNAREPQMLSLNSGSPKLSDFTHRMMYSDLVSYLPDDILVKVDRASMGVSLEARVPFLDHRVVEFAWRIPLSMKIHHNTGKWLLRQVLYQYVPKKLVERPKMGFGVPIDSWLRDPLKDWAESLLDEKKLSADGFFNPKPVREKWMEHLSGRRNWQYHLWNILMFQAWLQAQ